MSRLIDMTGRKCGMLMVIGRAPGREGYTDAIWLCRCDCGSTVTATGTGLRHGGTASCGCWRIKHGQANKTPEYYTWEGMKQRCLNPSCPIYEKYGGRGITVCERWLEFENFYADMGPRPGPGYSIDRINVYGGYEPGNCRWATAKEQRATTRRAVRARSAAELLRLTGYWPQRADFAKACMRDGQIKWWRAARFAESRPSGPDEHRAILDIAVWIAADPLGLSELDVAHCHAITRALVAAAGCALDAPDEGRPLPGGGRG